MAKIRFLKLGEISRKNKKYIRNKQIWQLVSVIETLAIIYLLFFKH